MSTQARPRTRFLAPAIPALRARLRSATTTVIAIGVVAIAVLLAAWINRQAQQTADQVSRAIAVRESAERFLGHLRDAETGQRGYLLTGLASYLPPFTEGRGAAVPAIQALEELVGNDPAQRERIAGLRVQMQLKLDELDASIDLMRDGRQAEALALIRRGQGIGAMEALRDLVQQIQIAENIRLVSLNRNEERRRLLASIGIVVALAGLAFAAWQQLRLRQRRSTSLAESNAELERIISERTRELENERLRIEALLRDVNHRVGNNLAMVSALLSVQSRQSREPAVRAALQQAQSRIQAIAAGQRRLRLDLDTDEIEARPYMEDLLAEIGKAAEGRPIEIALAMDEIRLPGRDAVSFVVIVNELVTNAIKHAFADGGPGRIVIRFEEAFADDAPALALTVEDDGVGLPAEVETKGLGQTVLASLLRSMQATMTAAPLAPDSERPGTCITLRFPKRDAA
ncbi:MAG TPA: CHASE3 domain-containing protein [Bosea sp. (in: a-proteobacteria)]|jgi:two-component sensor histidine kinase|uniref:sensor histidine kinase n=1 Tax=Bosea sp. (in: a-proteobacteria) TaxID=1871050 RepID=UPI002DDD233D|nr:CHASE3 domain-containing protein [Bosea sp. (in: a-proteobacteria)]HEV2556575.1 CHASE3 domain-containing protein [Bosea sp. (in: a-proteobacteria)]